MKGEMMRQSFKKLYVAVFALAAVFIIAVALCALCGCAPRSATKCLNAQSNEWVKCPAGFKAGETINSTNLKRGGKNGSF